MGIRSLAPIASAYIVLLKRMRFILGGATAWDLARMRLLARDLRACACMCGGPWLQRAAGLARASFRDALRSRFCGSWGARTCSSTRARMHG